MGGGGGKETQEDQNAQLLKLGVQMGEKFEEQQQRIMEVAMGGQPDILKMTIIESLKSAFEGYTSTIKDMISKFDTTTVRASTRSTITIKDKSSSERGSSSEEEEGYMSVNEEEEEELKGKEGEGLKEGKKHNEGGKRKVGSTIEGKEGGGEGGKTKERGKKKKAKDALGVKHA
jgi:hypothetical protein